MFQAGQQIGVYTLIVKLGRGGFGEVWLAEKRSQFVSKKVAVKLPHEDQVNFEAIRQEATLWEQASGHPNVLPIIDADVYDGQVVIVSEYADGGSLDDKLKRETKLSVQQAVEMTIGILSGLEFLHSRQIIHRDIKPQNILIQGSTPRLADFGISRAMNTTMVSSSIIGTDAYMSPEAFDGNRNVQTDIWSVGVVLYQLIKGSLPFPQEHPTERIFAVLTKDFAPLDIDIPADLRRIVEKSLAKSPEVRYKTTTEMREDLQKALIGIAHPTYARTEVFRLPTETGSDLPTITNQRGANEIETNINRTPPTQPAATQAAVPQSVVTNIKPVNLFDLKTPDQIIAPPKKAVLDEIVFSAESLKTNRWSDFTDYLVPILILLAILFGGLIIWAMLDATKKPIKKSEPRATTNQNPSPFKDGSGKYGYKDSNDKIIVQPKYDDAKLFDEDLALVILNNKYGFIDQTGAEVIPLKFDGSDSFNEAMAPNFIYSNRYAVKPQSIDLYLWDSFDFEGDSMIGFSQPSGCRDETGNQVGKAPPSMDSVCVFNSTFRQWRVNNNKGGDFYIFTDVLRATFVSARHLEEFYIFL